ncbi:MAG: hypothetical protein JSR91_16580 [Proteobacteria bacterium]|nr:hypothetical protein [Pseudomonadota bacterium]
MRHPHAMTLSTRHRRRALSGQSAGDLYDYVRQALPRLDKRISRHDAPITVTDDWPEKVPITEAELRVVEAYLGDVLDELFGPMT